MILTSAVAGVLAGAIVLFLSHVAPIFGAGNFVKDIDDPHIFGKEVTHREAHFLGILVHLLVSAWFGGIYGWFVGLGIFGGYGLPSILGWGVVLSVFVGGVVLPLEGHGIFGVREDAWFPVDLFLANIVWSVLFWWILSLWRIVIPS